MKKHYILLLLFLLGSQIAFAQINYQQQYVKAKGFFDQGSYNLAMESFKPLIPKEIGNTYSEYASFFYAISAYSNKYPALSRDMFLQIKTLYPKWDKMEDVNIWLSKIYFEEKDYNRGLKYSNEVSKNYELSQLQQQHYLDQIDSLELISELYNEFSNDKEVAYRYAQIITKQPLYNQDRSLLKKLVEDFNFDANEFMIVSSKESIKKDTYNIAVMLPFMMDKLQPSLYKKGNQFVLDVYEGILKAQSDLSNKDIAINVHAYDTKKKGDVTKQLLEQPEMLGMDLIVGPLYPAPSKEVSDFSLRNKINMFNPVSSNQAVIGENPFSFLYHPTDATQAKAAAQYVIENETNKNTMIFYGGSQKDSIKAHTFKNLIEQDSFNIVHMQKIDMDTSRLVLQLLTATLEDVEEIEEEELEEGEEKEVIYIMAPDSVGTIYVASDNKLLASSVVSSIEIRPDTIQVIGSTEWLKYRFIDYEAYERLGIVLTAANYFNLNHYSSKLLNHSSIARFGRPASSHYCKAYDMMMFIGNSLNEYGTLFQNQLYDLPMSSSPLTAGISYYRANDNQHVSLVQFKNDEIQRIELKQQNE